MAIGILGATVMPHNLYLHSSIVQTRKYEQNAEGEGRSDQVRARSIRPAVSTFALFINAAILIMAAATFHTRGQHQVAEIQEAYKLLGRTHCEFQSRAWSSRWLCWPRGRIPR